MSLQLWHGGGPEINFFLLMESTLAAPFLQRVHLLASQLSQSGPVMDMFIQLIQEPELR